MTTGEADVPSLSQVEKERYSRQLVMPEIGPEGQSKLKSSSVLVVGVGGLGTPASVFLVAAGVGRMGLVDFDTVQASNLHRQVLYTEEDVGRKKVAVARERLLAINPHVKIETHDVKLDSGNALDILRGYDVIIDGTDNYPARYLLNDACVLLKKPDVYASVSRFDGQISVFRAGLGPCLRCLFPAPPPPEAVASCAETGVLGVLPGMVGSIQAAEAMKLILGVGKPLVGRLVILNAIDMNFSEVRVGRNPKCPVCGSNPTIDHLIDYDAFCGVSESGGESIPQVDPQTLKRWVADGKQIEILDVREPFEHQISHLENSKLIPLHELPARVNELDGAKPLVIYCYNGRRSAEAVKILLKAGFKDVSNLRGGISAWTAEVDPSMVAY